MISYIKRKNLAIEKYNICVENSIQSRIYAFSWYLDSVADNWDVLVLNDYEAVMPIPWKQKFGLKYITQPNFCQQLGIFSMDEISVEIQNQFIKKIPLKFLKVSLAFNSQNFLIGQQLKKNSFVQLSENHKTIWKKYSKGRKHAVKVAEKNQLSVAKTSIQSIIEIQKERYEYQFSEEKLQKLSKQIHQQNSGEVVGIFKDELLLGGALFVFSKRRIVYLFSAFTELGRELQAASFLLDYMLKINENTSLIFDFEGGNIPNMATFYNSFGAETETYSLVTRTVL